MTQAPPSISADERDAKLVAQIAHCVSGDFYRSRFEELNIDPGTIASIEDLGQIPILVDPKIHRVLQEESQLNAAHPFGSHLTVDPAEVVSVSSTSGTTGDPTFYAFTNQDVAVTDALWQRALRFVGVQPGDWLPEVVVDFDEFLSLRTRAEEFLIFNPRNPGDPPVEVWSADSTYAVVLQDRVQPDPQAVGVGPAWYARRPAGGLNRRCRRGALSTPRARSRGVG